MRAASPLLVILCTACGLLLDPIPPVPEGTGDLDASVADATTEATPSLDSAVPPILECMTSSDCPSVPNATARCSDGLCELACVTGWGDCDGLVGTGCEDPLDTNPGCGACGVSCLPPQLCDSITPGVDDWACVDDCGAPRTACSQGCRDTSVDPTACGPSCDVCDVVAGEACVDGACTYLCRAGFASCGLDPMACETHIEVDPGNCGGCNVQCTNSQLCDLATCQSSDCGPSGDWTSTLVMGDRCNTQCAALMISCILSAMGMYTCRCTGRVGVEITDVSTISTAEACNLARAQNLCGPIADAR